MEPSPSILSMSLRQDVDLPCFLRLGACDKRPRPERDAQAPEPGFGRDAHSLDHPPLRLCHKNMG